MKSIYIFGSVVRGEIDQYSDTDLLLITDETLNFVDLEKYSLYTPTRIKEMYVEGNPLLGICIMNRNLSFLIQLII